MTRLAVWVVAVERHAMLAGEASALDVASPVTSPALQFAQRVVERAAQGPNAAQDRPQVFLNVSHPGRADDLATLQQLQQAGAQLRDATLAALRDTLQQLAQPGAFDLLLLYWVGHGVMQGNERLLVTADSHRADQLWALDLAGLLGHLRAAAFPPLQIGFFEACAQLVSVTPNRLALAQHDGGDRRQHFYFSASATELASDDTRRPGFTQSALATLQHLAWPPDPSALHADFSERLARLPLASRPTTLAWTDGSGDLWSVRGQGAAQRQLAQAARRAGVSVAVLAHLLDSAAGLVDAAALVQALRDGQVPALLQTLEAAAAEPAALAALRQAVTRWQLLVPVLRAAEDLALYWHDWRALAADELSRTHGQGRVEATDLHGLLLEVLDQGDLARGIACLLRVLERAARRARAEPAQALRQALQTHAVLQPHLGAALAALPAVQGRLFISVGVRLAPDQRADIASAWLTDGDQRQTLAVPPALPGEGLAGQLNDLIHGVVTSAPGRDFAVELLMPAALLCAPRELLELGNDLLGVPQWLEGQWPLVLRWLDRMDPHGRPERFGAALWKQQAHRLAAAQRPDAALRARFIDEPDPADLVLLDFPGPAPVDPQRNRARFFTALLQGHPYMGWPRSPVADAAALRQRSRALAQASTLQRLPAALVAEKQRNEPLLADLWLLIDDPTRNPLDPPGAAGTGLSEPGALPA